MGSTLFDGLGNERAPSYFSFDGTNGIRVPLDNQTRSNMTRMEYFFRLWLRIQKPTEAQLQNNQFMSQ